MELLIEQTSILKTDTEAIVNAANSSLLQGGGVCGVIFNAAGCDDLKKECDKIGHCQTGEAIITPGFKAAKYIIHAVGPIWQGGEKNEQNDLYNCYRKSLDLALSYKIKSITFPLISTGIYAYPKQEAITIAFKACRQWNNDNNNPNIKIVFAIPGEFEYNLSKKIINEIFCDYK